jgi:hypothetical protein
LIVRYAPTAIKNKKLTPKDLMLDKAHMIAQHFPIHSFHQSDSKLPEGWLESTIDPAKADPNPERIVAIDCEMVCFKCVWERLGFVNGRNPGID